MRAPFQHSSPASVIVEQTVGLGGAELEALRAWATRTETDPSGGVEPPQAEVVDPLDAALVSVDDPDPAARYEDRGFLARGGMGEVRRVFDRRLDRVVVQKILRSTEPARVKRFWVEATVTARLEHPGIIPVHDFGLTLDQAPFFTMAEVHGQTLSQMIAGLHQSSRLSWGRSAEGVGLRQVIDALHRAAQTVAYGHSRGIIHRDLKPDNIMIGAFGEVLVLDWGIALVDPSRWVQKLPSLDREGQVSGTPVFMAPEQAWGSLTEMGPWTDVWGLGAVLFNVLTGQSPYKGTANEVIMALRDGRRPNLQTQSRLPIPLALQRLCDRSLEVDPRRRPADAGVFAQALGDWLDGDRREEEGRQLVDRARAMLPEVARLRGLAQQRRSRARELERGLRTWDPVETKAEAWSEEDRAVELEREAELLDLELVQVLRAALSRAPELDAADRMLADHFQQRHQEALERGDARSAARAEAQLRRHDRGGHASWLAGLGQVSLDSQPSGQPVQVLMFETQGRRLVAVDTGLALRTPVESLTLPEGSYLFRFRPEGPTPLDLPLLVRRGRHERLHRPGLDLPAPVPLPRPGSVGEADRLVPAGWSLIGDPQARGGLPRRRVWVDAFVMRRDPVTNAEYLCFLNDLVERGEAERASGLVPRASGGDASSEGALIYHRDERGRWGLGVDPSGDEWHPDWPVLSIRFADAMAYAAWERERSGLDWRLPYEMEWERAATGADGRRYPWGEFAEPTWARCAGSQPGRSLPGPVGLPAEDCSPFGVRGMAGNSRDWTLDERRTEGPPVRADGLWERPEPLSAPEWRVARGGAWAAGVSLATCAARYTLPADYRISLVGFRLCRTWPGPQDR